MAQRDIDFPWWGSPRAGRYRVRAPRPDPGTGRLCTAPRGDSSSGAACDGPTGGRRRATLKDYLVAVRDQFSAQSRSPDTASLEFLSYFGCLVRQEGSAYRSGSTYLVLMNPGDGTVVWHAEAMRFSGRRLDPSIHRTILSSLGVEPAVLADLDSPNPGTRSMAIAAVLQTLSQEPDGRFDATTPIPDLRPGIPGASGHAAAYMAVNFGFPLVLLSGFDINEAHVATEEIDFGSPTVTAEDVVDRETLKAFVTQAGSYIFEELGGDFIKAKVAFRDPNGPWRHGSVYLYILDRLSNVIVMHAAFPDRFELRSLVATVRDAVTGELILPQVIEAAKSMNRFLTPGSYQVRWDARDQQGVSLPSAVYIARLSYPGGVQTRGLLYLK